MSCALKARIRLASPATTHALHRAQKRQPRRALPARRLYPWHLVQNELHMDHLVEDTRSEAFGLTGISIV